MVQQTTLVQDSSLEFVPYKGEVRISLEDRLKSVSQKDIGALAQRHREIVGENIPGLQPNFATEGIYNLVGLDYDIGANATNLTLGLTTGTMAKALQNIYKGKVPDQNPVAVQGMILTSDNYVVLGTRSKPKFRANHPDEPLDYKLLFIPAGYAKFAKNDPNPLQTAFYSELEEELGLTADDVVKSIMLGHNRDFGFTEGTRINFLTHTKLTFAQLVERWKKAEHSWEYIDLVAVRNDPQSIKEFLGATDFSRYSIHAKGLVEPSVRPVLTYYANNFKGYHNL